MIAVFDTSVVASAIFWHKSTARRCLAGLARRKFTLLVTEEIERDLLDLGNPFGIAVVTPVEFLRVLRDQFGLR